MPRFATDQLWKVLPRNATQLERDLLKVAPFDSVLDPAIPRIITSKRNLIPESWLPWLVLEYGLSRLQEFVPNTRQLVEEGPAFNRLIGTPAAIYQILTWMGLSAELWEEPEPGLHFAEFQLKLLANPPTDTDVICKLARGMDIAKPARGRFRRLYNDAWNIDRFRLDESDWGDLLGNYSGVYGPVVGLCGDLPLWVSLGYRTDLSPENGPLTGGGEVGSSVVVEEILMSRVSYNEWVILDEEYGPPAGFYPTYYTVSLGLYEEGNVVDEFGEPILVVHEVLAVQYVTDPVELTYITDPAGLLRPVSPATLISYYPSDPTEVYYPTDPAGSVFAVIPALTPTTTFETEPLTYRHENG